MSQFNYLRTQLANNVWAGKPILTVADAVNQGVTSGKDWYFSLPHIQFIMANPVMAGVRDLLVASQTVGNTVIDCSLVFLETVNGVNRAYNSKAFTNLAGKGQQELASLRPSTRERIIYEASVMAYNEALNLPNLSVTIDSIDSDIRAISSGGQTAEAQIDTWKAQAISRVEQLKAEILATIESMTGNPRRNARARIRRAEAARIAMTTATIPNIIAHNPYSISSTYNHSISSIYRHPPVVNTALVPIAVGGAATIAGAVGVLTSIASWLLGSFFLKSFNIPAVLLPALTNTVVSIVLKLSGSSGGAEAVRYLAASALKAGASLLPRLFGTTGMQASGWAYLMSWAAPIIGAAVVIATAMRNRTDLAEFLYVFADVGNATPRKFNLSVAHLYDTNQVEILEQLKTLARNLKASAVLPIEDVIGVGLNTKKEYVIGYDLNNPDNPVLIPKDDIPTRLGTDKVARIVSGKFYFGD
ncbi:hypothetical protein [Microcoleus sp. B4-C1]|uniref:hypothetical protein n=1 Tax=Microcoleus sp. B4-C1 TaxID=2818660 RepID=UPI002FCE9CEE